MKFANLNAAKLSALSGVSEAAISRYIRSARLPSTDNLIALANALNVSADYLLGLTDSLDSRKLVSLYSMATNDDKRVLWTLLEKYGGNNEY